jgi:hypothetical protein
MANGKWASGHPKCGCKCSDLDTIYVTCCGNNHTVLLGPVTDGYRWAESYTPTDADVQAAIINAKVAVLTKDASR